jgi:hypothetical protein
MAKMNLHDLVRALEAEFDEHIDESRTSAKRGWSRYLEKAAMCFVAAEYAARGEWEVDENEFVREFERLSIEMDLNREARPRRLTCGRDEAPGPIRPLPDHIVRSPFEPVRQANDDGEPIH